MGNWNFVNRELDKICADIFYDVNLNNLSDYEKRKMIFEYLCKNIKYDYELLDKIKSESKVSRNPYLEVESVLIDKVGICNAIAQVYKLLLEKVGIYSLCVICDDGTEVKHQLNLVYNEYMDTFSFDDVTSVIVSRGEMNEFFDYDIEEANKNNQGCRILYNDLHWCVLPTSYVYYVVGRNDSEYKKYYNESSNILSIPENIVSNKKRTK